MQLQNELQFEALAKSPRDLLDHPAEYAVEKNDLKKTMRIFSGTLMCIIIKEYMKCIYKYDYIIIHICIIYIYIQIYVIYTHIPSGNMYYNSLLWTITMEMIGKSSK